MYELVGYRARINVYDPWIDPVQAEHEYQVTQLTDKPQANTYDAILLLAACAPERHPRMLPKI